MVGSEPLLCLRAAQHYARAACGGPAGAQHCRRGHCHRRNHWRRQRPLGRAQAQPERLGAG